MQNDFKKRLLDGCKQLSLDEQLLSPQAIDKLLAYHQLLIKWNKAYNLTAVRDPVEMISRHLLDSLAIIPFLQGERWIDVGSGAGLPGIVLAIIFPHKTLHLLDSNGKKTRFLFQVKTELQLANVTVHHSRVEQFQPAEGYDGVLSRAFATLEDMVVGSRQLLNPDGHFYAMKGVYPEDELKQLSASQKRIMVKACHALQIPGEPGQRHLLVIGQNIV